MCLLDHDYDSEYELMLSAWGDGILAESGLLDMQKPDTILSEFRKKRRRAPKDISLLLRDSIACGYDFGFTGIDPAFLEKLKTLKELILPPSVTHIEVTPPVKMILEKNNTLIRGAFDSYAEQFAADRHLRFRHSDFEFANYESERPPESTQLTVLFRRSGDAVIKEDIRSPGTSASNTLGGIFYHKLGREFYLTSTAEEIAAVFPDGLSGEILADGRLAAFIEQARSHPIFTGKNR